MITKRQLGSKGPELGCLGYGAMVLEGFYGGVDESQSIATIQQVLDLGMDLIDSADAYGTGHNESLIAKAIKGRRDDAFICTKFGIFYDENAVSANVHLDEETLAQIDQTAPAGLAEGATLLE